MATTENESAITISTPSVIVNNESGSNIVSNKSNLEAKSRILRIGCLVLWIFTLILLLIAMIVLCTDSITSDDDSSDTDDDSIHFDDIYAYRYMLSVIVIGIIYIFVRLGFLTYQIMISTKVINAFILFDFYGDKFISYLLATGTAAGFGVTVDMNAVFSMGEFSSKGYASATLVLIAFLCTAIFSVLSSYALAKLA